jgi:hypothetical protein
MNSLKITLKIDKTLYSLQQGSMLFNHRVYDDYYAEESIYPYPPKDIQLIILRYAANIDIETCKNIRLVRKCFANDKIILKSMSEWITNFDIPFKYFEKIKQKIDDYQSVKDSYADKMWSLWARFRRNYSHFQDRSITLFFNYIGATDLHRSLGLHMDNIKLIEPNKKYGEVALLIKSRSIAYPDVLFFLYFVPKNNINYAYNEILSHWVFRDEKTLETLRYIEKNDEKAIWDNVVLDFNDFEVKLLNAHCTDEQNKTNDEYKGVTVYFGNIDITIDYLCKKGYGYAHYNCVALETSYPLPKNANTDIINCYLR